MEQDRSDLRRVLAYVAPYWRRLVLVPEPVNDNGTLYGIN